VITSCSHKTHKVLHNAGRGHQANRTRYCGCGVHVQSATCLHASAVAASLVREERHIALRQHLLSASAQPFSCNMGTASDVTCGSSRRTISSSCVLPGCGAAAWLQCCCKLLTCFSWLHLFQHLLSYTKYCFAYLQ
jgi:hypothetical protein